MGTGTEAGAGPGERAPAHRERAPAHRERAFGRRRALAAGLAGLVTTTAGCTSTSDLLGPTRYDAVRIDVDADTVVWSGEVSFQSTDGTRVQIPVDRALGSRSYVLPEDIDADAYDAIAEPIVVVATPERGVTDDDPLVLTVRCDGEPCGNATSATIDEPARVTVD